MSPSATIDTSTLAFSALSTNNKGAKQLPAPCKDGEPWIWQPDDFAEALEDEQCFGFSELTDGGDGGALASCQGAAFPDPGGGGGFHNAGE